MSQPDPDNCPCSARCTEAQTCVGRCIANRREAERRVIAVRGSSDVPGFEACVDAELRQMKSDRAKGKANG